MPTLTRISRLRGLRAVRDEVGDVYIHPDSSLADGMRTLAVIIAEEEEAIALQQITAEQQQRSGGSFDAARTWARRHLDSNPDLLPLALIRAGA